jgi:aldehyde dehydrogenase (NAD+)
MHMKISIDELDVLRRFFQTGVTRAYGWRRERLQRLYALVAANETAIQEALYADLKKGPEEAYATETGLVLSEIRYTLKHLSRWMRPRRVRTNLVNLPASSTIYHDPLGVILVVAPWNYPFLLSLVPLAAAIAAGNTAVLKPSELAPATAALLERLITENFPPEVVRVVQGDGATVIPEMLRQFRFDHIFFTGSVAVGRSIYKLAAETLTPVTLELGGKSPAVVAEDADVAVAARRIVLGKFTNAGQTCIAPDYLLVHADVRDRFLSLLQETITRFYGSQPEVSPDYGRIINEKRFDTLVGYLDQGRVLCGGRYDRETLYIEPTLLTDIDPGASLMQEEIFGPLLPILTYRSTEEAMAIVRAHPDPLAFYLFTGSRRRERQWVDTLSFGGGCINNTDWHFTSAYIPFGGVGNSGLGAYHGKYSFDLFTHRKPLLRSSTLIDPAIKYPPFRGKLKWFKLFLR